MSVTVEPPFRSCNACQMQLGDQTPELVTEEMSSLGTSIAMKYHLCFNKVVPNPLYISNILTKSLL